MTTHIILPATQKVQRVCDALDALVGAFIAAYRDTPLSHEYESGVEALNLFKMAIRNVEGVIQLARHDLVLLPPALAASRACFECAVKAAWMVNADDPFDRESRWLVHLASEERYYKRLAEKFASTKVNVTSMRTHETQIREFRLKVEALLPQQTKRLSRMPSFDQLLEDVGVGHLYPFYVQLSQSAHGEHAGTWLYRSSGVGTEKVFGEFIDHTQWGVPLLVCFLSFNQPARLFLDRLGGDSQRFLSETKRQEIASLISALQSAHPANEIIGGLPKTPTGDDELVRNTNRRRASPRGIEFPTRVSRSERRPKIGRNAPCSCGSGKKYKFCCGNKSSR
jgi:hypothetical protein